MRFICNEYGEGVARNKRNQGSECEKFEIRLRLKACAECLVLGKHKPSSRFLHLIPQTFVLYSPIYVSFLISISVPPKREFCLSKLMRGPQIMREVPIFETSFLAPFS